MKIMITMNKKWTEMKQIVYFFLRCLSRWFRDSGITCIWCLIENIHVSWDKKTYCVCLLFFFVLSFYFCFSRFSSFLTNRKCKNTMRNMFCFLQKKDIANVLQGCFWCDVLWKNLRLFARGQRCQNKVSFDGPPPEQIK